MNDLDLLRSFGDDLVADDSVAPAHLRHRVTGELASARTGRGPGKLVSLTERMQSRGPRTAVWGLGAAATVVALTVVVTSATTGSNGVGSAAPAKPGSVVGGDASLNGSQVLLLAAEHAGQASTATGKYWMTATEYRDLTLAVAKTGRYKLVSGFVAEDWTARSDAATGRRLLQELEMTPAGKADRAAWKRAGSPAKVDLEVLDQASTTFLKRGVPLTPEPLRVSTKVARDSVKGVAALKAGNGFPLGQQQLTLAQVRDLPSNQSALRKFMLKGYLDNAKYMTKDDWLFSVAPDVLTLPVAPKVRASAYRILAGLSSVKNLGTAKDVKGRSGTAVAIRSDQLAGTTENRLIIDVKTGNLLAEESRLLKPIESMAWLKPTDVRSTTVVTGAGWTDKTPPAETDAS